MWVYYAAEPTPWWGWLIIGGVIAACAAFVWFAAKSG